MKTQRFVVVGATFDSDANALIVSASFNALRVQLVIAFDFPNELVNIEIARYDERSLTFVQYQRASVRVQTFARVRYNETTLTKRDWNELQRNATNALNVNEYNARVDRSDERNALRLALVALKR